MRLIQSLSLTILFGLMQTACSSGSEAAHFPIEEITESITGEKVFTCNSPFASKYHYDRTCEGLSNCTKDIRELDKTEAEENGFEECGYEKKGD